MRETIAGVLVAALLGVGCEGKTSAPAPAGSQAASPAVPPPAIAPARSEALVEYPKPERKAKKKKALRVAKASTRTKHRSGNAKNVQKDAGDPLAPTLRLSQSPPSTY